MGADQLKDSIQALGWRRGIIVYFDWNIANPASIWWRKNVSKKKWCVYRGYFCKDLNCEYAHLDKPWETPKINLKSKCDYCGGKAEVVIHNPNGIDMIQPYWTVCKGCEELIEAQENLSMGIHIAHVMQKHGASDEIVNSAEDRIQESKRKIAEIEKKIGKKGITFLVRTDTESGFEVREL